MKFYRSKPARIVAARAIYYRVTYWTAEGPTRHAPYYCASFTRPAPYSAVEDDAHFAAFAKSVSTRLDKTSASPHCREAGNRPHE